MDNQEYFEKIVEFLEDERYISVTASLYPITNCYVGFDPVEKHGLDVWYTKINSDGFEKNNHIYFEVDIAITKKLFVYFAEAGTLRITIHNLDCLHVSLKRKYHDA